MKEDRIVLGRRILDNSHYGSLGAWVHYTPQKPLAVRWASKWEAEAGTWAGGTWSHETKQKENNDFFIKRKAVTI